MAKRIIFQFDDKLDYQLDAVNSAVELFRGLPRQIEGIYRPNRVRKFGEGDPVRNIDILVGKRLIENLNQVQLKNTLFSDDSLAENNNFTIEMETGTGKTYVYLRTILELNKEYGFTKFMIVVPSIAIRKGIEKSIDQLREHFKALYDIDLAKHSFVYDSNNPKKVSTSLVETSELSICVLNIQAFNKDTNKIRTEDEYGQILWNDIQYIRPIVIIDEPQKIEGTKTKKSKSLQAIEELNPLFTLRYSATHKQLYNQIYKLDSYAAYKKRLVKGIQVKTVHGIIPKDFPYIRYVSFTSDLKAKIEMFSQEQGGSIRFKTFSVRGGASLEELSGGLDSYKNMRIAEEPHKLKPLKIAMSDRILDLQMEHSNYEIEKNEAVRIQIRLAIKNHFEKQFSILRAGKKIKALTLFFIDSVNKVRNYETEDGRGEYLRLFDEEYSSAIENYGRQLEKYKDYFPGYKDVRSVREGYFAVDKKNNIVEVEGWDSSLDENNVKAKSQEDIDRGISLILERKDELISFEEPLAFIFSHSALREGWDNPNVFTLCTLKSGGSDIAKKQEIGRGLRLPVDITGNRCLDTDINELTVIANDYYDHFAAALQADFNDNMNFNKNEVTADILIETLQNAGIPEDKVTAELINILKEELVVKGIITTTNIIKENAEKTNRLLQELVFSHEVLKEHSENIKKKFKELMVQKGSRKIEIKNGDNEPYQNGPQSYMEEDDFIKLYEGLCEHLTKRTLYKFNLDKDVFIGECVDELNDYLRFIRSKNEYKVETGKGSYNDSQMFVMESVENKIAGVEYEVKYSEKTDFEIVNYIMYHTMLPRMAIFRIISGLEKRELLNNQDVLDSVTQKILKKFNDSKASKVTEYELIDGYELEESQIFDIDSISEEDFETTWRVFTAKSKNALNRYYKMDSEGEYEFAKSLESNDNVLLFTKLKKGGFVIDTPYGNYSPDWAVICRKEGLADASLGVYFIVETKKGKQWDELTSVEQNKIKCGRLHFDAVSKLTHFDWVNSYKDFLNKFGVKESI